MECWYCGAKAAFVRNTSWDNPDQSWPVCDECDAFISAGVQLREEGHRHKANALDDYYGISTDGSGGKWTARYPLLEQKAA